jgi:hypothetical protein
MTIAPQFTWAEDFSEGLARIVANRRYGYIDKAGKKVIDPQFDVADDFKGGLALAKITDKTGYIDKNGRYIWHVEY